jgi:hypothetical protein
MRSGCIKDRHHSSTLPQKENSNVEGDDFDWIENVCSAQRDYRVNYSNEYSMSTHATKYIS